MATQTLTRRRADASVTPPERNSGFPAHVLARAEANRIPYRGVPVGTVKRHIAGKGSAACLHEVTRA